MPLGLEDLCDLATTQSPAPQIQDADQDRMLNRVLDQVIPSAARPNPREMLHTRIPWRRQDNPGLNFHGHFLDQLFEIALKSTPGPYFWMGPWN